MNMELAQALIIAIICLAYALGIYILGTSFFDFIKYCVQIYTFSKRTHRRKRKKH